MNVKKILLCLDGSEYASSCCGYAAWLAGLTGAEVDALYVSELWRFETPLVADVAGSMGAQPYLALTSRIQEIEAAKAAAIREGAERQFAELGQAGRLRFHHRTGMLVDCLAEFEEADSPADLVVIGKRGENAKYARGHAGSNMERVVRAAHVPVVVANRAYAEPVKALLAYDGSPSANVALTRVAESPWLRGLPLHVVNVTRPGHEDESAARLADAERALRGRPAGVTTEMLAGSPGEAIERYVNAKGINLLVMGAYGHSAIRRLIIGSVTTELATRCKIPLALFR